MSSEHPTEHRLNDYAEDLLPPEETVAVAAHLAICERCAAEIEAIRTLRSRLASMPAERRPGVDLRPGIVAAMAEPEPRARRIVERGWRVPAAAAAAVLVLATVAIVSRLAGPADPAPPTAVAVPADGATHAFMALDAEYGRASRELREALDAEAARLGPAVGELVRENLAVVDRALEESRAALAEDPASGLARELVLAAHRQRLDVLRQAAALVTEG